MIFQYKTSIFSTKHEFLVLSDILGPKTVLCKGILTLEQSLESFG